MAVKLCALVLIFLLADAHGKVQALTQSMGQEVIEMASPDKELPADLEEEPSAESVESKTSTTLGAATQNVPAKSTMYRRVNSAKDEEARIEKELAELYRDPDYKDSGEANKTDSKINSKMGGRKSAAKVQKPVYKAGPKFQPEDYSEVGLARFRTQTDKVECTTDRKTTTQPRDGVESKKRVMMVHQTKTSAAARAAHAAATCLAMFACTLM